MPAIRPSQEDCLDRPQREAAPGFRLWRTRSVLVGVAVVRRGGGGDEAHLGVGQQPQDLIGPHGVQGG